jgi:hypothetical protein
LQKFARHVHDEGAFQYVLEPFEYICHSSHGFASLFAGKRDPGVGSTLRMHPAAFVAGS